MRGDDDLQEGIFSYISPEKRVPADHPLRPIRKMVVPGHWEWPDYIATWWNAVNWDSAADQYA
jgi:hypothetical protein